MIKRLFVILSLVVVCAAVHAEEMERAVPVRTVAPEYPAELKRQGMTGLVMVTFTVTIQGTVENPVVEKSPHPDFAREAVAAVKKWKFRPARLKGEPIENKVTVPIQFRMEG